MNCEQLSNFQKTKTKNNFTTEVLNKYIINVLTYSCDRDFCTFFNLCGVKVFKCPWHSSGL